MVKRKQSSTKILLLLIFSMIQLLQLTLGQPFFAAGVGCTSGQKRNNGLDPGGSSTANCIATSSPCITNSFFKGFYNPGGDDCFACTIGRTRASATTDCTNPCTTGANTKYLGHESNAAACGPTSDACKTGYLVNAADDSDCTLCDTQKNYVIHEGQCKQLIDTSPICGANKFDGTKCVNTFTVC